MKIAFHVTTFSIRGTEIAIYDYALYNQKLLGNRSIILVPKNHVYHKHPANGLTRNLDIENKFRNTFQVFEYDSIQHMDEILEREGCGLFYVLKGGHNDGIVSKVVPTAIHCVFYCFNEHKHGSVYAAISDTINNANAPVIPHICRKMPRSQSLRQKLGIPEDATVFGRYGGADTFDIDFAREIISRVVRDVPNVYFLFMNTEIFDTHSHIIHVQKQTDLVKKSEFISTCDAMLHARKDGESFGLAIAEFTSLGKSIICWRHDGPPNYHEHLNHIDVLGDTGIYYKDADELYSILTNFVSKTPVDYSEKFSPENVMVLFDKHFIKPFIKKDKIKILCNWETPANIHEKWRKMIGDNPIELVLDNPDYYVIINKPPADEKYDRSKTIVMGMEPDTFSGARWQWFGNKSDFLYFLDENYMNNCEWWLSQSYDDLRTTSPVKTKTLSSIVSSQYIYPGHKLRIDFLRKAEKELDIDLYGWDNKIGFSSYKGSLPNGKDNGLLPYKYTVAAENSKRPNYCTEKIYDAILSECLCFYWGCPNMDEFIEPDSYIALDLSNYEQSLEIIKDAIRTNQWEKRLPVIRRMKLRILEKFSFFSRIHGLIKLDKLSKRTINLNKRPEKWEAHSRQCSVHQVSNVKRFPAIEGDKYLGNKELMDKLFILTANFVGPGKNTGGIVGCALSHYVLWQEIVKTNRPMLIMEDDVTFAPRFIDKMGRILTEPEHDLVFIGYHTNEVNYEAHKLKMTHLKDKFGSHGLVPFEYMSKYGTSFDGSGLHGGGTFGYLLSVLGARKLLAVVAKLKFHFPVDYQLLVGALYYGLNTFVCPDPLVTSPKFGIDTDKSDIQA
jgi:GR25 family glycosyltransferase involved in LPS biosynthesis